MGQILIASADVLRCASIEALARMAAVGFGCVLVRSATQILERVRQVPSLTMAVIDLEIDRGRAVDLISRTRSAAPSTGILSIDNSADPTLSLRALRSGATGLIRGNVDARAFVEALTSVRQGRRTVPEAVLQLLCRTRGQAPRGHEGLSNRKYQVLKLLGSGNKGVEVARAMSISVKTLTSHRRRILDKLGLRQMIRFTNVRNKLDLCREMDTSSNQSMASDTNCVNYYRH
ncbi:response regulator transcription factor [Paraburkholderia sp. Ac-20347]|uniref:LuxR C-terminal-related transcriptional regulator n=1 Tax=Paraburkholderia sp. Ac-20347 TaxID=2703892 RepID=UPI00197F4E51|nr:response regulator transcription factor [Paraburkholderia sp. Ac-20347]MBN3813621.1 response regulator transcription factor [Paraburkholderia sp. Ac-20347]